MSTHYNYEFEIEHKNKAEKLAEKIKDRFNLCLISKTTEVRFLSLLQRRLIWSFSFFCCFRQVAVPAGFLKPKI